ncbi:MAG: heme exporter protein CcmB [Acidobacteriia bacterium]|nr:heme exporter protein CcmB [Terriglobia bacterium]
MSAAPGRAGPGFLRGAWVVAAKDLRIEWRTLETLSAMVLFSLIVLVVFNFAFDLTTVRQVGAARLVPGVLWVTFAFSGIVGFARSFAIERHRDSLSALVLAPVDRSVLFAGKTLANLATVAALEAVVLPLSAVFFDYDLLSLLGPLVLVVLLHTLGLCELGTLFAAIAARVGRGEALLATLLFPVASPLFIAAVKCTAAVLDGKPLASVSHWMLVTAGFDVLYFLVAILTFEFILED